MMREMMTLYIVRAILADHENQEMDDDDDDNYDGEETESDEE
jgi:hypothetical protein